MLPFSVTFFLRSIFSHCRSSRQIGFVVFFVGSVLSTAAQNMPMVLVGRGLSGVGAAFMLVVSTLSLSACNASSLFRLLAQVVRVIFSDNRAVTVNTWRTVTISFLFGVGYGVGQLRGVVKRNNYHSSLLLPNRTYHRRCTCIGQLPMDLRYQFTCTFTIKNTRAKAERAFLCELHYSIFRSLS